MKITLLLLVLALPPSALGQQSKPLPTPTKDRPYKVVQTLKSNPVFYVPKACVMTLQDGAMVYAIRKNGYGNCRVEDLGSTISGHMDKDKLVLVRQDGKGNPKTESWKIVFSYSQATVPSATQ